MIIYLVMRKLFLLLFFLIVFKAHTQSPKTIEWINHHAIEIEDSNPDSELTAFANHSPEKFQNARIYGFGELSHDGKEYFNVKAKFFKYLVKNHGVRTFIMEAGYQAESSINTWIIGTNDDITTLGMPFQIGFWYSEEIFDLIRWMRVFNLNRPENDKIKFYGIDVKSGKNVSNQVRQFLNKYDIPIRQDLLDALDECSAKPIDYSLGAGNWAVSQVPKLEELQNQIILFQTRNAVPDSTDFQIIQRAIDYLINYTQYVQNPQSEVRDEKMFENARWIIDRESKNGKAFIWAHNEHINKRGMWSSTSGIINLGKRLKDHYGEEYYCVGFDFGIGSLKGYDSKKGEWKLYTVEKPFKGTYSHSLFQADKSIFFIDMDQAKSSDHTNFFSTRNYSLSIGGGGFQPKPLHKIKMAKIYSEEYDGLIFIKEISPANNGIKIN